MAEVEYSNLSLKKTLKIIAEFFIGPAIRLLILTPALVLTMIGHSLVTSSLLLHSAEKRFGRVIVTIRDKRVFLPSAVFDVLDRGDESLYRFGISLKGNGGVHEMKYDEVLRRFELDIPEGVYEVYIEESPSFKRANFFVRAGGTEYLFIDAFETVESICDKKLGFAALPSHHDNNTSPKIRYDSFLVNNPYKMVIKYCEKKVEKGRISYKPAFLTYKNLTVYAERATLDRKTYSFRGRGEAEGKVGVADDDCIKKGANVIINLRGQRQSKFACRNMRFY